MTTFAQVAPRLAKAHREKQEELRLTAALFYHYGWEPKYVPPQPLPSPMSRAEQIYEYGRKYVMKHDRSRL